MNYLIRLENESWHKCLPNYAEQKKGYDLNSLYKVSRRFHLAWWVGPSLQNSTLKGVRFHVSQGKGLHDFTVSASAPKTLIRNVERTVAYR